MTVLSTCRSFSKNGYICLVLPLTSDFDGLDIERNKMPEDSE